MVQSTPTPTDPLMAMRDALVDLDLDYGDQLCTEMRKDPKANGAVVAPLTGRTHRDVGHYVNYTVTLAYYHTQRGTARQRAWDAYQTLVNLFGELDGCPVIWALDDNWQSVKTIIDPPTYPGAIGDGASAFHLYTLTISLMIVAQ